MRQSKRDYTREYMRRKRAAERARNYVVPSTHAVAYDEGQKKTAMNRASALYDPLRDGPVQWESAQAVMFGDPPVGRRAIDSAKF